MPKRLVLVVILLLCCCVTFAGDHRTFYAPNREPIFIPASEAFTPSGDFADIVPEHWRDYYAPRNLSTTGSGLCTDSYWGEQDIETLVPRDTRQATLENAKAIFVGTVAAVIPGLTNSGPVSILQLDRLRVLKRSAAYANVRTTLYVRYPYAAFATASREFCRKTSPEAVAPAVGDRIIVFAYEDPIDDSRLLINTLDRDLIAQLHQEQLQIPEWLSFFKSDGDFDGIVGAIARELPGTPHGAVR